MPRCLVSLGANQGDRDDTLKRAADALALHPAIDGVLCSPFHKTAPHGGPSQQPPFLNAAVRFDTEMPAAEVLALCLEIEHRLGRVRQVRWAARTADLDLLLYGQAVLAGPDLVVPHPRMAFRRFVLEPAAEVAAEMLHPIIGWTIAELLANLNREHSYVAVTGADAQQRRWLAAEVCLRLGAGAQCVSLGADLPPTSAAAGPGRAAFIEFWQARAQPILAATWPESQTVVISDDWFERPLVELFVNAAASGGAEFQAVGGGMVARVVRPKLVILIHDDQPSNEPGQGTLGRAPGVDTPALADKQALLEKQALAEKQAVRGEPAPVDLSAAGVAHASQNERTLALHGALLRPGVGPVLVVPGDDPAWALDEATAAIESMF